MLHGKIPRRLGWLLMMVLLWLSYSKRADAYPWMIRHDYAACATCHTDPSGGGLLTRYGRVQAAVLLSSRLGLPAKEEEPGPYKEFAFGLLPLPEMLDVQEWLRAGYLVSASNLEVVDKRFLLMRADAGAHLRLGALRASGMLGLATADARGLTQDTWITSNTKGANLVSREHWIGAALAEDAVLVRAGRMNLPFGLRNIEHASWVRNRTRTDTNQDQQHGVALSYTGEKARAELMAVLGNYQLSPDVYRERGYSGYVEYAVSPRSAVGVSSSILHADADLTTRKPAFRQGHGLFGRFVPVKDIVLLAEADAIVQSPKSANPVLGGAGLVQVDYEAVQGLHLVATGEALNEGRAHDTLVGGWLSLWWFAFAHFDGRIDLIERTASTGPATTTALFQIHGYL